VELVHSREGLAVARVSSYMSSPVYVVRPSDTLAYARNLMLSKDISRLVVVDDYMKPVGMISITDIANTLVSRPESTLDEVLVRDVMSVDVKVVEYNKTVKTAAYMMLKYGVGGLPVIDENGELVGVITRSDIMRAFSERYRSVFKVEEIARKDVSIAKRSHSVSYVVKLLNTDPSAKVIVVDDEGRPAGVITRRDIAFLEPLLLARRGREAFTKRRAESPLVEGKLTLTRKYLVPLAEDIMTPDPVLAFLGEDAAVASSRMVERRIGCLPVVDENRLLKGVLTKREILLAIVAKKV
jgi:CBS domain-containing protein